MPNNPKLRIAIDMDEVLTKFNKKLLQQFNHRHNQFLTEQDLSGTKLRYLFTDLQPEIEQIIFEPSFFRDLEVMEHSQAVVRELHERYDVYIATAAMFVPTSFHAKYEWLIEHFPFLDPMKFVFCGEKGIVNADYLIDDNAPMFREFRGQGLLFTSPHNIDETHYPRMNNWLEIRDFFAKM